MNRLKEQVVDPLYLSSSVHSMRKQASLLPSYHFIQPGVLPSNIRVVDISKPFADVNSLVVQLRNIDSVDEDNVSENVQGIDICSLFTNHKAIVGGIGQDSFCRLWRKWILLAYLPILS